MGWSVNKHSGSLEPATHGEKLDFIREIGSWVVIRSYLRRSLAYCAKNQLQRNREARGKRRDQFEVQD